MGEIIPVLEEDVRIPFNIAIFSGRISATYPKRLDNVGREKISFVLKLMPSGKKGKQCYVNITCYDLEVENNPWFKTGNYVYTQCNIIKEGFYILDSISNDAHDCYKGFIQRIYDESGGEELIG